MSDIEVAIVGAGVIGLACAARLARAGRTVIVIERHVREAEESSTHNSGVIHAGLYYAPGSLKATTCAEGRERLYARCQRENLPHQRCGKLVVASAPGERATLEEILARGLRNGAGALRLIEGAELRALEPRVHALCALWSPETGIVDAHELCASYKREALAHGAAFAFATQLEAIEALTGGLRVRTRARSGEVAELVAERVINAAGLGADRVAELAGLDVDALGYRLHPCKGDYFSLRAGLRGLVQHLVYPVPAQAGLGIHLTLDLAGGLRAGPDTEYVASARYDVDAAKAAAFGAALRRYVPEVQDADLSPDYAGVRAKLQGPGQAPRDFVIEDARAHGAPGLVNLIGIESPGLTASEAIAERVAALL
jgi:L-2-hydroxyglutarate oxidase LhgO